MNSLANPTSATSDPVTVLRLHAKARAERPSANRLTRLWRRLNRNWVQRNDYFDLYFYHLRGEYLALPVDADQPGLMALAQQADVIIKLWDTYDLEWGDIFDLETIILQLQSFQVLQRRAWDLREQYKQLVGSATYDAYVRSNPPDPAGTDPGVEPLLRHDLSMLLDRFHWRYGLMLAQEATRSNISISLALFQTAVVVLAIVSLFWDMSSPGTWPRFPVAIPVFIAGMLGGFVSTQLRLQKSRASGADPIEELVQLNQGKIGIITAPLLGGIFAVILYVIFAGQFIDSALFPKMSGVAPNLLVEEFWNNARPANITEIARLLLWSFLAGFAERLVPDALDRIAATNTAAK